MPKKSKKICTYTLIEQDRCWEVKVGTQHYVVQKLQDHSSWTVKNQLSEVVDQGQCKTLSECLIEMGQKYSCIFILESEKDADIRIFGKPIACKRY